MAVREATTTDVTVAEVTAARAAVGAAPQAALVGALLRVVGGHFEVHGPGRSDQRRPTSPRGSGGTDVVADLEWERLDAAGLRHAARELQRAISALEHQQRQVLRVIDARRAFAVDGSRDDADWSANNLGVSRRAANDKLRLGRELAELPRLRDAAAAGELSTEQARPAAELARAAGTDAKWAAQAPNLPVGVLSRHAAKRQRPSAGDRRAAHNARHFRAWIDGLELRFRGSLPTDEGARLLAAVERALPGRDPHAEVQSTPDQRRADGLAALAGTALAADGDPDRATVVLVAELAAICDDDPAATAELETGQPVATATARRLVCDGRTHVVVQDRDGVAVGVGVTNRVVTPAMRRALLRRDGRCRFGGCTATRFLHAHHIVHWPSPTTMGNLALLCWHHHHAVHEGGWTLSGDPNGALQATNQTGTTTVTSHPRNWLPPDLTPPGMVDHAGEQPGQPPGAARGRPPDRSVLPLALFVAPDTG